MPLVNADKLHELAKDILMAAGATERNADRVAEALVSSNLSGVDSHGVWHLPRYVTYMENGDIVPDAAPEILSETATTALITGNWTFGHIAAKYAMEIAIQKASEQTVAVVSIVQVNHIGRLGEYAELAASSDMISIICGSGYGVETPSAAPYGGRKPALHTNPISIGFPAGEEQFLSLDYATTTVSGSKVILAQKGLFNIPTDAIIDSEGNPSSAPSDFFEGGAQLPFGRHKGYALMVAIEALGRILAGSDTHAVADRGGDLMRHQGVSMIVIKADAFRPLAQFTGQIDDLERSLRNVPAAPGFDRVLSPGDPEKQARRERLKDGIPIPEDVWDSLVDVATSLEVMM